MNELPIGPLFTASGWSQQRVKSSTVSRYWNRFFQNCMLYKNIPLTSGNLSEELAFPFLAILIPEGSSEPAEGLTAVAFCVNCVFTTHSHWCSQKKQNNADHYFPITYTDRWCCLHLIPRGCAACESEFISICKNIPLIKKSLGVSMILAGATEAFLVTTAIINFFIFKFCSVHMHYIFEATNTRLLWCSQSQNLFSSFPHRNTLMAVNLFIFTPSKKILRLVMQSVLHCEKPLLKGILVLCQDEFGRGKETSGQGMQRHFSGRVTKAALSDLKQGKQIYASLLGAAQNIRFDLLKRRQANHGNGYILQSNRFH